MWGGRRIDLLTGRALPIGNVETKATKFNRDWREPILDKSI